MTPVSAFQLAALSSKIKQMYLVCVSVFDLKSLFNFDEENITGEIRVGFLGFQSKNLNKIHNLEEKSTFVQ
jgi:hypothetical protein